MKNVSKLFALLLAVVMVLSMIVPAFAANENPHTITLTYEKSGHTYKAYQIFKGDLSDDGKLSNIEWGTGVNGEAILTDLKADATLGADFADAANAEQVAAVLTNYDNDSTKIEAFGRIVAANLTAAAETSTEAAAGDVFEYSINVKGDGYYIVMDAGEIDAADAATKYILQVLGDVNITAKADVPTLEKKIDENGTKVDLNEVFVGDKISYVLTSKVPKMDGYNKYFFVINDTMSKGLTFNNDVVVKIGSTTLVAGTDYTVEVSNNADGTTSFQIIFKNFIDRKAQAGQAIEVTYSATLNEDANIGETGNPNVANLVFSNNPNENGHGDPENPDKPGPDDDDVIGKTPDDEVITYTSGIKLVKVDTTGKVLTGAKFKIEGVSEKVVIISEKIFVVSENGTFYRLTDGTYTEEVANSETEEKYESTTVKYEEITVVTKDTEKTNIVTEAWVDANGVITFEGLGEGTFTITEIEAPEGYNKLTKPITIVIDFDEDGERKWSAKKDGDDLDLDGNIFIFQVENKAGATLPTTGGMGTTLFYAVGGILVLAAVVLLITKKRMSNEA
jgi:fimbrial isopeptide formation D2 family protein/LPXTG-motif cell wall-anchored protein